MSLLAIAGVNHRLSRHGHYTFDQNSAVGRPIYLRCKITVIADAIYRVNGGYGSTLFPTGQFR